MKTPMKHFLVLFLVVGFTALAFTGCQTAKGLGRDVENLGESMQKP
jgi:predicted small secreted protein